MKQVALRGRDFEQSIKRDYLEQLNRHYESWVRRYRLGPLLVVESDSLDFVSRGTDLEVIVGMIQTKLKI
jgi:deoxyadenosine/deoxycytidine kinase